MDENKHISAETALIYLLGCGINGFVPEHEILCGMDWKAVHQISVRHTLAAAVCMAVESGLAAKPFALDATQTQALAYWKDAKNKAIRKNMLLDSERTRLADFCESVGCWYMPLKGSILKDLYPHAGMRQMADNDILFDPAFQQQICDWFVANGYTAESVARGNHDVYHKPPVYNFELHTALFNDAIYPEWAAYYADVKSRLRPVEQSCGKRFSDEDFYIYITLHEYKHFHGSGTGLRSLVDCYVLCNNMAADLDAAYIQAELKKLGIAEFEEKTKQLAKELFLNPSAYLTAVLTADQKELLDYYLGSGTYGKMENRIRNKLTVDGKITGRSKAEYLLSRMFLPQKVMLGAYPRLARCKVLLPLCYVHRLVVKAFKRREAIQEEFEVLKKV